MNSIPECDASAYGAFSDAQTFTSMIVYSVRIVKVHATDYRKRLVILSGELAHQLDSRENIFTPVDRDGKCEKGRELDEEVGMCRKTKTKPGAGNNGNGNTEWEIESLDENGKCPPGTTRSRSVSGPDICIREIKKPAR
jgi:hypothetical protein